MRGSTKSRTGVARQKHRRAGGGPSYSRSWPSVAGEADTAHQYALPNRLGKKQLLGTSTNPNHTRITTQKTRGVIDSGGRPGHELSTFGIPVGRFDVTNHRFTDLKHANRCREQRTADKCVHTNPNTAGARLIVRGTEAPRQLDDHLDMRRCYRPFTIAKRSYHPRTTQATSVWRIKQS